MKVRAPTRLLAVSIGAILTCSGCARSVRINTSIDLLSFFTSVPSVENAPIPTVSDSYVVLLPEVFYGLLPVDWTDQTSNGFLIDIPDLPLSDLELIEAAQIVISLSASVTIENLEETALLPSSTIRFFIASPETANVYENGIELVSLLIPSIAGGSSEQALLSSVLTLTDLETFGGGEVRVGLMIELSAGTFGIVFTNITLTRFDISISAFPFELLVGL